MALKVWKGIGNKIEMGSFDLPEGGYPSCKVKLAEFPLAERSKDNDYAGLEETIWIERLSPCHGIVRIVLYNNLGVDYGDVVLIDGAPITYHKYGERDIPVFPHLTRGILDSSDLTPNVPLIFSTIADQESVYRSDGSPYSDGADALISYHLAIDNLNVIPGTYGSYLVRDATQVSNPNVLYLLMLGSGFVLFLRFNKHK